MTKKDNIPPEPKTNASPEELSNYYEKYGHLLNSEPIEQTELEQQRNLIKTATTNYKNKRNQLNLTIPEDVLITLKKIAKKKGAPVSTLARMWLMERLDTELGY